MSPTIAIALSGGIDSLTAAVLLRRQGHDLIGLHFVTGYEPYGGRVDAARTFMAPIAAQVGIALHVIDLSIPFQKRVVNYFTRAYARGMTPNPCLVCNPEIKFGLLFERARKMGVRHLATGHYARTRMGADGQVHLLKGIDALKDQSYFLSRLTAAQLKSALFPLGGWTKQDVKRQARTLGLRPATTAESQDICFVNSRHYGDFMARQPGFAARPGPIEDTAANRLGMHQGLHLFTIGQRRGINCPSDAPWYVIDIDPERDRLVVGRRTDLMKSTCRVEQINWICDPPAGPIDVHARIRYRHAAVPVKLTPLGADAATLDFIEPETAVTPGQGAVFYRRDEVLGGGWIERTARAPSATG